MVTGRIEPCISGSNIGIVGMDAIGSAVAKRANGYGMPKVLYHNRNRREVDEKQFGEI